MRLGVDFNAVMVRVSGIDKGDKANDRAFFTAQGDFTSLSASGIHFFRDDGKKVKESGSDLVLTVASVVAPFLSQAAAKRSRSNYPAFTYNPWSFPLLEKDAHITVGLESSHPGRVPKMSVV